MKNISSTKELREAILILEQDKVNKLELLKLEVNVVIESIKPENLIKNSIKKTVESSNIKENLIDGALGLLAGYLSKKLVLGGGEHNPIKNIVGNLIQFGMAGLVSKNSDEIKSTFRSLIKSLISKKQKN